MVGPLVYKESPNLVKSGWVIAHPDHSSPTSLRYNWRHRLKEQCESHLVIRKSNNTLEPVLPCLSKSNFEGCVSTWNCEYNGSIKKDDIESELNYRKRGSPHTQF